jgi:hypothetical protein
MNITFTNMTDALDSYNNNTLVYTINSCKELCTNQCQNHLLFTAFNSYMMFLIFAIITLVIFAMLYFMKGKILPEYRKFGMEVSDKDYDNTLFWILIIAIILLGVYVYLSKSNFMVFQ